MSSPAFAHILCYEMIKKNSMEYPFVLPLPLPLFFLAVWQYGGIIQSKKSK